MLSKLVVYIAYYVKCSAKYNNAKCFFYDLIENPNSKQKNIFDSIMILLVVLSVFLLLFRVDYHDLFGADYFEAGIFWIFVIEYLLRLWLYSDSHKIVIDEYEKSQYLNLKFSLYHALGKAFKKKLEYIFSIYAIIDLLAILPSYRSLRILRIFLVFRLFKLFRYSNSIKMFAYILSSKRFELMTLWVFFCFLVFIASASIYLFENTAEGGQITNFFDAFYLSIVTLSTLGYGDLAPKTFGGKIVIMLVILTGLGVLSFFTSILVTAFNEKMHSMRENQTYVELSHLKNFVIVCGFGRVGREAVRQLANDGQKFVVIDKKEQNIKIARQMGFLAICDDASKNNVLIDAGINRSAIALLCTTGNDVINVYITLTGRHLNKTIRIIARANSKENINKLYQAGADSVVLPFEIAGLLAAEYLGQPVAFEAILGILQDQKNIVMETVAVSRHSLLENQQIMSLELEKRKLSLLGVISANPVHLKHKNKYPVKHQHFYFNPEPHFRLLEQDILVLLGRKLSIDYFRNQVEQSRLLFRGQR